MSNHKRTTDISWPDAPDHATLSGDDIHVYAANVSDFHEAMTTCHHLLSEDEKDRAERYIPATKKRTYAASRALLRLLLGRYLGLPPASLQFSITEKGKPFLPNHSINFNLSHSGDIALYAFSRNAPVGIDVERLSSEQNVWQTAVNCLSTEERNALAEMPPAEQNRAFYMCWACKEAFIKALGETTAISKDFDIVLTPPDGPRVGAVRVPNYTIEDWNLHLLEPCTGYLGALAAKDVTGSVFTWNIEVSSLIR